MAIPLNPSDSVIAVLPFFHSYGALPVQFGALQDGARLVTVPRFDPEVYLQTIVKEKVTVLHVVPPIVLFLAKHPLVDQHDISSARRILCAAAPLSRDLGEMCEKRTKVAMTQGYGLTEASPAVNIDIIPSTPGTVGPLLPDTFAKVIDSETGAILPVGESGEYCIKGPQLMKGYYNNPGATRAMIKEDGWMHTGDLAHIRADGRVVIDDRLKELMKYKGHQVAPAELEHFLQTHPQIQDVAVIGVPDEASGDLPRAYVVKKPDSTLFEDEILSFVKDNLSSEKHLRGGVVFVDEIPKSASGKILRRVLRKQAETS